MNLKVYDLIGNTVFSYEGETLSGTQQYTLPLHTVADGTYIVSVQTREVQFRKKLILQR